MAQSQVLNVHYLWLQPESELSSPEPFTPPACLSAERPPTWASLRDGGRPNRALSPKSRPVRPRDGRLTVPGMRVPTPSREELRWAKGCTWGMGRELSSL